MAIYAHDLIGIDINQFGEYELDQLEILFDFLDPLKAVFSTGAALDVGANIGNHSLHFARHFAQVHAFEPHPDTSTLLRFNTQWVPHIKVHGIGLGKVGGHFDLFEQTTNLGGSSMRKLPFDLSRRVSIEVRPLDELDPEPERLCFMKIDVEGLEADVLAGGVEVIQRSQPLIVLEQSLSEFDHGQPQAVQLLHSLGYRFAWHQQRAMASTWIGRRWMELRDVLMGQRHRMVTGEAVAVQHHSMLVAVPRRFQATLGLDATSAT